MFPQNVVSCTSSRTPLVVKQEAGMESGDLWETLLVLGLLIYGKKKKKKSQFGSVNIKILIISHN